MWIVIVVQSFFRKIPIYKLDAYKTAVNRNSEKNEKEENDLIPPFPHQ